MTREEFVYRFKNEPRDCVVGYDADMQHTLYQKDNKEHWCLTKAEYEAVVELFKSLAKS